MAEVIESVGHINRKADDDLFSSVVHHIIGQQISTRAQQTIWQRMQEALGEVTATSIDSRSVEQLQSLGMTFRKAEYIKDFCRKVLSGEFDLKAVDTMSDEVAIAALSSLKGIGVWTAEMILLFCLQRPDLPVFEETRQWLDEYFSGQEPQFTPPLTFRGSDFRKRVWQRLLEIPYGQTVTYGQLAQTLGCKSAQAVGGAVGHNPLTLIVPCHRVVGTGGSLTGYAGGIDKKVRLLQMEGAMTHNLFIPTRGTAL